MTAHQKALAILQKRGPMEPADFARATWPMLANRENPTAFSTAAGDFLVGMVRAGLVRKMGRRYGVKGVKR